MKKIKMLACILMSVAMVLMFSVPAFTALADDYTPKEYTITITPKDKAVHTFEAYQIFTGEYLGDGEVKNADGDVVTDEEGNAVKRSYLGSIKWGNGVNSADLLTALTAESEHAFDVKNEDGETVNAFAGCVGGPDVAAAVAEVLNKHIMDKMFCEGFADVVKTCLTTPESTATCENGDNAEMTVEEGYYLIKDADDSLVDSEGAYTDFILKVVKNVTVAAKSDVPTIDKKIVEGGQEVAANIASIGDRITYKITSNVPNMEGYNKYFFIMNDTMDKGLTFDEDSVTITVGNVELTADTDGPDGGYKLTTGTDAATGATTLKIVFRNFLQYTAGDEVVVTYDAVLNKDANITTLGNENKVDLTFSNNPNYNYTGKPENPDGPNGPEPEEPDEPNDPEEGEEPQPTGKTPEIKVTTYTTGIEIIKVDASGNRLTGAQFQISGTKLNTILKTTYTYEVKADGEEGGYYKKADGSFTTDVADAVDTQEYTRKANQEEMVVEEEVSAVLEVGADGTLVIKGLNAGEYKIEEVRAADGGYNMLTAPVMVTIDVTDAVKASMKDTAPEQLSANDWVVTVALGDTTLDTVLDGDVFAFDIVNYRGILLPDAGAIGTTIIYVLGAASVIVSLLYFRSRRKAMHK